MMNHAMPCMWVHFPCYLEKAGSEPGTGGGAMQGGAYKGFAEKAKMAQQLLRQRNGFEFY